MKFGWTKENFLTNGRLAMVGVMIMIGTYLATGQVIPNIW